ncbi:LPP20 family lipoprotein [Vibrio renipiscarius]|uniref:LPP20 lipoprotein n=1 Tax=Vibrio renipiscarius TaxID=1461322 RepID=A0A0C2NRV7_9VIBR|nr:LPP20 family lipoprotein [Vibrio renipiscarius]KII82167.1 hypothetical protein OJ16_00045 [Vibrio renipiscarius]KII82221.1 hypothetical protein PL18_02140 [Vibrio renipiscarius]
MNIKTSLLLFTLAISGCQSTSVPDWYLGEMNHDPQYIYAVGEGFGLSSAQKSALTQVNEQLWTQVDSNFMQSVEYRAHGETTFNRETIRNRMNVESARLVLSGAEFLNTDKHERTYYAQVRVKRDAVKLQLNNELDQIEQNATRLLNEYQYQDKLTWWLANKDYSAVLAEYYLRLAILDSMGQKRPFSSSVDKVTSAVSVAKSGLLIYIKSDANDVKSADLVVQSFNPEEINTTQRWSNAVTHQLVMDADYRRNRVGEAYITTKLTQLTLKSRAGKTLASNEIISTANSMSNFTLSHEGAERHFGRQIEEMGIWSSLGFK